MVICCKKIKILVIYEKCPTNILLEEAMTDLLKKYDGKKAKGKTKRNERQNSLFEDECSISSGNK